MKNILSIIILSVAFNASLFAQEREEVLKIWGNPKPYLEAIRSDLKNRDLSWEVDKKLGNRIQGLAFAINQEILAAESKDWAHPSDARIAVIEKWGKILEPYAKELLFVAMEERKTRERSSTQARSILDFAKPTEEFATEIRKYISTSNPRATGEAVKLLHEHRLLSEQDKNVMRQLMSTAKTENEKVRYAQSLYSFEITDWEDFLISNAKFILERKPNSNDPEDVITFYESALRTAGLLKTKAEVLIPLLNALVEYMKDKCPGYLPHAESARDAVLGLAPDDFAYAKNGSGPLAVKIGDSPQPKIQDDQSRKDTSLERPEKSRSPADGKSSDTITEKPAPFPWWLIMSSVGILVLALAGWLKSRKSKSTH
jgi:hypothetical protein